MPGKKQMQDNKIFCYQLFSHIWLIQIYIAVYILYPGLFDVVSLNMLVNDGGSDDAALSETYTVEA